ncbi:hypothetical protein HRG_010842 [Hirsutella rhossiliensis]|uniref:PD-(D/E)XK nuclease-like domain-containing protein n=1 Tax=Hirsutella rhossiliensis TaxID=111463 RepID=A0A9P8MND3_9HYPO|nr:uncharacterized protein HRG_10842 [Hirsutella rhossiliensis]KAH0958147.1 hypothetical protein HRG_10842 [Hirsutella rhossiliensis]
MVDYALVLCPSTDDPLNPLAVRLADFVQCQIASSTLPLASFNQTSYAPLAYAPTAVVIETKVDSGSRAEGRVQLGLWLAAWCRRISSFGQGLSSSFPPPTIPVLLVTSEKWEINFSFDLGDRIDICLLYLKS